MTRHRLGVMGGTFDPVHHGHLVAASEVPSSSTSTRSCWSPPGVPGRRRTRGLPGRAPLPDDGHRDGIEPAFTVSRVDIDRPGPTYTIDTLRDLYRERPDAELFFITGADALSAILSWKDVEELCAWRTSSASPVPGTT